MEGSLFSRIWDSYTEGAERGADVPARKATSNRLRKSITIVLILALVLGMRLFYLQVLRAPALADTARELRTRSYVINAKRGSVLDSAGNVLATSVERYNVRVDQQEILSFVQYDDDHKVIGAGPAAAAKILAPKLDMDRAELGGLLLGGEEKSRWQLVTRDISPDEWREINALGIKGIYPERFMKREYPNGYVAGTILGYIGETEDDPQPAGRAGIESSYNKHLAGKSGELVVEVGPAGTVFPQGTRHEEPAVDGSDVQLTIERDLQQAMQEALDKTREQTGAEWATGVMIEIGTGRILALGDTNSPDPGNLDATDPKNWNSRAVSAVVEPGSSGKLITFAAALDQKLVTPTTLFPVYTPMTMPNGEAINDNEPHPARNMTVAGILAKSYNTGLVQIGDKLSDATRFKYMQDFGLGQKTGIELPGEEAGVLYPYKNWDGRTRYNTMFGQGWSATTLQLGEIASIIGNNGVKVPLRLVDGTYDAAGEFKPTLPGKAQQVISAEAAQTLNGMMQASTQKGSTGYLAKVPGYNVAGKTGTAQVPDANGRLTKRVGTYVAFLPAENPQVAFASVFYNAGGSGYGSDTAAAVFGQVGQFAMRYLKIPPSTKPLQVYPWYQEDM